MAADTICSTALHTIPAGSRGTIAAIPDDLAADLAPLRVLPGEEIEVVEAVPFGGPLLVRTGGGLFALGRELARRVSLRA